jgi:hypothetical protein
MSGCLHTGNKKYKDRGKWEGKEQNCPLADHRQGISDGVTWVGASEGPKNNELDTVNAFSKVSQFSLHFCLNCGSLPCTQRLDHIKPPLHLGYSNMKPGRIWQHVAPNRLPTTFVELYKDHTAWFHGMSVYHLNNLSLFTTSNWVTGAQ